jgi:hypothetical protein
MLNFVEHIVEQIGDADASENDNATVYIIVREIIAKWIDACAGDDPYTPDIKALSHGDLR